MIESRSGSAPEIHTVHPLLPPDTLYVAIGNELSYNFSVWDGDSILGASLIPILPLPEGAWLDANLVFTGANSGEGRGEREGGRGGGGEGGRGGRGGREGGREGGEGGRGGGREGVLFFVTSYLCSPY